MTKTFVRGFLYLLFAGALAEILFWEARTLSPERLYSELGYTEWAQSLMLLACATIMFLKAKSSAGKKQLAICLALAFTFLLIRENDFFLDQWLFHGSWKYLALVPLLMAIWTFWSQRRAVSEQWFAWSSQASFGVMLSAFVVLVFSRLFGRTVYWESVMGDAYIRVVKNAAEEGVEFLALGLMLLAVLEFRND